MIITSYRVVTKVRGECDEVGNAMRFASAKEARAYGRDLRSWWKSVESWRIKASQDPPNYRWDIATGRAVPITQTAAPISGAEDITTEETPHA